MDSISQTVADFYCRHPYPSYGYIEQEVYGLDLLNLWGGYGGETRLHDNIEILIAGCGTNEAVCTALSYPKARIIAIDISEESIAIAKRIASAFQCTNIEFMRADLLEPINLGPFDYISSFGVLHHLSNPSLGLSNLKSVLKPNGLMQLMLYSESRRYMIERIQRIVTLLAGSDQSVANRMKIASEFVQRASSDSWPYGTYLARADAKKLMAINIPAFADTYLHPQEISFNYSGLNAFLARSGLSIVSFNNPDEWDVDLDIFGSEDLGDRFRNLDQKDRYELIDMLNGPLYDFYARDANNSINNIWMSDDEVCLALRPKQNMVKRFIVSEDYTVQKQGVETITIEPFSQNPDFVTAIFKGKTVTDNRLITNLIPLCDGKLTCADIILNLAAQFKADRSVIEPIVLHLIRRLFKIKGLVHPFSK